MLNRLSHGQRSLYNIGLRPFLNQIPTIPSIQIPKHIAIVNGGASFILAALEKMQTDYRDKKNTDNYPKKISLILTPALTTADCNNKFIEGPFGQSVRHLGERKLLLQKKYSMDDRPSIKAHFSSVFELIHTQVEDLKGKFPFTDINIHYLETDDVLRYYPKTGSFHIANPHKGDLALIFKRKEGQTFSIIDASRPYGKFLNNEIHIFDDRNIEADVRERTCLGTDLYRMTDEQIRTKFEQSTSTRRHIPIIGAGLTTLWMIPTILEYGFTPLIINTDSRLNKGINYVGLMTHANEWIITDLCGKLECTPEQLNEKLSGMTINANDISIDRICSINGEKITLNQFYDSTGYCQEKSFLENVPYSYIIDPCIPMRVSLDYIQTIREKGLDEIHSIEDGQLRDLIDQAFSEETVEVINQLVEPKHRITQLRIEENPDKKYELQLQDIKNMNLILNKKLSKLPEDVEKILRARKILMICTILVDIDKSEFKDKHPIKFQGFELLSLKQQLFKMLRKEMQHKVSKEIASQLKLEINEKSLDGRNYSHHGHAPAGSATALKKLFQHLLGVNIGFDLTDALTTDAEIEKITNDLQAVIPEKTNRAYLQQIIERTMRDITSNSHNIYEYTKKTMKFRYTVDEFADYFYQKIREKSLRSLQGILDLNKDAILAVIKKDMQELDEFKDGASFVDLPRNKLK